MIVEGCSTGNVVRIIVTFMDPSSSVSRGYENSFCHRTWGVLLGTQKDSFLEDVITHRIGFNPLSDGSAEIVLVYTNLEQVMCFNPFGHFLFLLQNFT